MFFPVAVVAVSHEVAVVVHHPQLFVAVAAGVTVVLLFAGMAVSLEVVVAEYP